MTALITHRLRPLALLASIALLTTPRSAAAPIPAREAATHVGETLVVTGTVAQVSTPNGGATFINLGQRHPNSEFTLVIRPGGNDFGDLKRFEGKPIEAEGKVELYKDKPQMVIRDPAMLREAGAATPAPGPDSPLTPAPAVDSPPKPAANERPGKPEEFPVTLSPEEKKLAGRSPSGVTPQTATVAMALPKGFDPARPHQVLIAFASDKLGSNNQNLHRFSFPANRAGWIAVSVNGSTLEDGLKEDWHAAMTLAAIRFLHEKYPESKSWNLVVAGSGLGAARASMVACALIEYEVPIGGVLMTSFGTEKFDEGQNHFRTKKSALRGLAVFASRGANDHTPLAQFEVAEKQLRSIGFKKLLIDKHAGGPENEQQSLTKAFEWLAANAAPATAPEPPAKDRR